MALRIHRDPRSGIWQIRGTFQGVRVRKSTGATDRDQAERIRASTERAILEDALGQRRRSWAEAVNGYLDDGGEARFLGRMFDHFDGRAVASITPAEIRQAAATEYRGRAASTINRQGVRPVQAVINWAHGQGWCPPIRVKAFPEAKPERRAVDVEWLNAFMAAAPDNLAALFLFMFTTGARIGEAVRLRWQDVDMDRRTALLRGTKNGTDHLAHLSGHLAEALGSLSTGPRVFGYSSRHSVYKAAQSACSRAGIDYVPPHQAGRHSFATHLDRAGEAATTIARGGNWKSVSLVQSTYIHPDDAGRRVADIMGRLTRS